MKGATRFHFSRPTENEVLRRERKRRYELLDAVLPPSEQFRQEEQAARNLLLALLAAGSSQPEVESRAKDAR